MAVRIFLNVVTCVSIGQLEEEKEELQRLLSNEKNARQLQEKINEEQQRFQQHLHDESMKTSSQKVVYCHCMITVDQIRSIFFFFSTKHMFWVLKSTASVRQYF